jgi:glycosyltransferase involved in cell wall biosynthesis
MAGDVEGNHSAGNTNHHFCDDQSPYISVCITTRNRPGPLDACLASLERQGNAPPFELLICCHHDPEAAEIVRRRFPNAAIGLVDDAYPGGARNFLIERARGEILLFLDDDVVFGDSLLADLTTISGDHPHASVFGGPNLTPENSSLFQVVQGAVLSSIIGTGPVRRRYGKHPASTADERFFTLCNMAVRREAMVRFPPGMSGGEENAVLAALALQASVMFYDPRLVVFHERRSTYRGFVQQMNKYGRGRGELIVRAPRSCRPSHLAPILLAALLLCLPVLAIVASPWWLLAAAGYGALLGAGGVAVALPMSHLAIPKRAWIVVSGAIMIATVHLCYAAGVVRGLFFHPPTKQAQWRDLVAPSPLSNLEANSSSAAPESTK